MESRIKPHVGAIRERVQNGWPPDESRDAERVLCDRVHLGNWVGHDYDGRGGRADSDGPSHRDGPACSGAWFWHHL